MMEGSVLGASDCAASAEVVQAAIQFFTTGERSEALALYTTELEVVGATTDALRSLRNGCTQGTDIQSAKHVSDLLSEVPHLLSAKRLNPDEAGEGFNEKVQLMNRVAVQFVCNACVSNLANQAIVWKSWFPNHFEETVLARDEGLATLALALIYICAASSEAAALDRLHSLAKSKLMGMAADRLLPLMGQDASKRDAVVERLSLLVRLLLLRGEMPLCLPHPTPTPDEDGGPQAEEASDSEAIGANELVLLKVVREVLRHDRECGPVALLAVLGGSSGDPLLPGLAKITDSQEQLEHWYASKAATDGRDRPSLLSYVIPRTRTLTAMASIPGMCKKNPHADMESDAQRVMEEYTQQGGGSGAGGGGGAEGKASEPSMQGSAVEEHVESASEMLAREALAEVLEILADLSLYLGHLATHSATTAEAFGSKAKDTAIMAVEVLSHVYYSQAVSGLMNPRYVGSKKGLKDALTSEEAKRYQWLWDLSVPLCRILANLTSDNVSVISAIHEAGGTPYILSQSGFTYWAPTSREWAVVAVRNMCEGSSEVREAIEKMEKIQTEPAVGTGQGKK